MCKHFVLSLSVFAAILPTVSTAGQIPSELTAQDLSALVALEATQNDLVGVALGINQPIPPQQLGKWTGTIDRSGWSLTFAGVINDIPLSITQTGILDLATDRATWTDSGVLGGNPISGSGFIEFDPRWGQVFFGIAVAGVQVLSASTVVGGVGGAIVSGLVIAGEDALDEAAEDLKAEIKRREQKTSLDSKASLRESNFMPDPLNDVRFRQAGTLDVLSGLTTISSEIAPVPEPSSFALLGAGTLGLLIRHGWRRRRGGLAKSKSTRSST